MRAITFLLLFAPTLLWGQICNEPSPVSYTGYGAQQTESDYFAGSDFLDGLNNSTYWSLGTGISDNNLAMWSNADVHTFLGVKARNTTAPNDNVSAEGNTYLVEPGYSLASQNGSVGVGPEANWNILMYAGLEVGAFDSVEVIMHIDFDPCFKYEVEDMYSINIGNAFEDNPFTSAAGFSSFGINTNMGSEPIAALNPAGTGFLATLEGYYTFAIQVLDNCGNQKLWNEITVYVQSTTTSDGDAVADANGNNVYDDNEFVGCANAAACNYDCKATTNQGCEYISCSVCTVEDACNYNSEATIAETESCDYPLDLYGASHFDCAGACLNDADNDGVCDEDEVVGCQDNTGCNYNAAATDAGSCSYPATHYNCAGDCLNDADTDGTCDELEVDGCTSTSACNYNSAATDDDGSCESLSCAGCTVDAACNYDDSATISSDTCNYATGCDSCSGAQDGSGTIVDGDTDNDGVCNDAEVAGCTTSSAANYNPFATDDDGSCEALYGCTIVTDCNYDDQADYFQQSDCSPANGGSTACSGDMMGSPAPLGLIVDCTNPSACNYNEEGPCEWSSCIGCMNEAGCDYDVDNLYSAPCDYTCYGCTNVNADNYDTTSTIDDNSCVVSGCTTVGACNYDSAATTEDGSCDLTSCIGCNTVTACNYDSTVTLNEPISCVYAVSGYDCSGSCITDTDSDGVCDEFEVAGCTDGDACNYASSATDDDGSCTYPRFQLCGLLRQLPGRR